MKDCVKKSCQKILDWKVTIMETWVDFDQIHLDSLVDSMQ